MATAATISPSTTEHGGIKQYYQAKIEECELVINDKSQDLRRLEAQRNALNAKGKTSNG
jgi:26S proteasome regulatory subunit T6